MRMRVLPDAAEVAAFAGGQAEDRDEALVHAVTAIARSYTRGEGFSDDVDNEAEEDICAVIVTAAARLAANPTQLPTQQTTGPYSYSVSAGFRGWNLAETMVLNRYRKTAA